MRAQTAKAIKHTSQTGRSRQARSGTDGDAAIDEDANALDAKAKRHPGSSHTLDVEA
ncbi:hypothetical protein [Sphingomonas daechungensis]|uniref:hypothetical protein n=1 Tax=Sphingomonas daechungensis TaxID=1176646 RepID=UPI001A571DEF|nr:hypothetical protein [Rhodospirillales bacterium]